MFVCFVCDLLEFFASKFPVKLKNGTFIVDQRFNFWDVTLICTFFGGVIITQGVTTKFVAVFLFYKNPIQNMSLHQLILYCTHIGECENLH